MAETRRWRDVREHNLDAVLSVLSAHGPRTRNSIAEATGLHKSSIASLVGELADLGVLRVRSTTPAGFAGRPAEIIDLAPGAAGGLGLEIAADRLVAHVSDLAGTARYHAVLEGPFRIRRRGAVLEELAAMAFEALDEMERQHLRLSGITIAAPDFNWPVESFGALLERPDVPVTLDSTLSLAALAESYADCLYVAGGDSIGARFIANGEILDLPEGFAHLQVEVCGRRCHCGRHGCLETRTRRGAILAAAGLGDGSLPDLVAHAHAGDRYAIAAIAECGRWLGIGLSIAVNLLAPPAIVLAGDFAALAPWLLPSVESELRTRVFGHTAAWPTVAVSQLGPDAAVLAAATLASRRARSG